MSFWFQGSMIPEFGLIRPDEIKTRAYNRTGGAVVAGELLMFDAYIATETTHGDWGRSGSRFYSVVDPNDHPMNQYVIALTAAADNEALWVLVVGKTTIATVDSADGTTNVALGDKLYIDTGDAQVGANALAGGPKATAIPSGKLFVGEVIEAPSFTAVTGKPMIYFNGLSEKVG